ncbi:hypothetical protein HMPREF2531_00868 [Bacteroides intestinalis]|uniref:Uncharacterized protein n=1 Tax=Bacteroides intestinalis TaxID=329854 RepID=A0A139LSC6_9BACE|nr:hypothetical protein HMPREF2531_00868 [Bacteroides intestinalis]
MRWRLTKISKNRLLYPYILYFCTQMAQAKYKSIYILWKYLRMKNQKM